MIEADIIELTPRPEDLRIGAAYAAITLPWTFNRMMKNTVSRNQRERGLNIAKGIVAQEMVKRKLEELGIHALVERKSHRDDDLFDFHIPIEGVLTKLDLKTINHYSNYQVKGREPLTKKLIADHASYPGPDWRTFFPMMVAHTQIKQDKEIYCFAITTSIDFRRDIDTDRSGYALTAFPYGESMAFLGSAKLCLAREAENKGFYLDILYQDDTLFGKKEIQLSVLGEWAGENIASNATLKKGRVLKRVGPFSCVESFQISKDDLDHFSGEIQVQVGKNDFKTPILNITRQNINRPSPDPLIVKAEDFCNLILPNDYKMYMLGWITKADFLEKCKQYSGWVWPKDSVDPFSNQLWSQITEKDENHFTKAGFGAQLQRKPPKINAGWLKTTGKGNGACCFVFPNIPRNGGIKETNLYVLPQDLSNFTTLR